MKQLLTPLALFLVASFTAGCGCAPTTSKAAASEGNESGTTHGLRFIKFNPASLQQLGVKVEPAGGATSTHKLQVPGSLDYSVDKYAEIGTLVEGRIKTLNVRAGDKVTKNQLLATVIVPSVAAAQAEYQSSLAAMKAAEDNARREEALLGKQLTTAREAEIAKSEAQRTKSEFAAAAAKLQVLGVGVGEIVQGAGMIHLRSPIDGVVVRRNAVLGRFISPQESAFVIADPHELRGSLDVYEADSPFFQVGSEVEITVDAVPGKLIKGTISLIEPLVGKSNRALRAIVPVANPDGSLRPGLFIRAAVTLGDVVGSRLYIQAGAVQPLGDADVVFVEHEAGNFEIRKVTVVRRTPQIVEIGEGLTRNERIAVEGAFLLRAEVTKQ